MTRKYKVNIINNEELLRPPTKGNIRTIKTNNIYKSLVDIFHELLNTKNIKWSRVYYPQEHQINNNEFEIMRLTSQDGNMEYKTIRTLRFAEVFD
jgi:hypothetical protein